MIEVSTVRANPYQPRRDFSDAEMADLKRSIAQRGVLQPIVVRIDGDGFQLIAGERRLRACRELGMAQIPAAVRACGDEELLELALIENVQRQDLNPIEKASAFRQLLDDLHLTHEEIALQIGIERSSVSNYIRLLDLSDAVRELVASGSLSMGHARALLALPEPEEQEELARRIVVDRLSVRETEHACAAGRPARKRKSRPAGASHATQGANLRDLERRLERSLGTKVRIVSKGAGGEIVIDYYSSVEFERLLSFLEER